MTARVLVVDDDRALCEVMSEGLRARGYDVEWRLSVDEAVSLLDRDDFDLVVADVRLEGKSGLELCGRVKERRPELGVIMMTGFGGMDDAIGAIRAGAFDFVTKPVSLDVLCLAIERAAQHRAMTSELERLRHRIATQKLPKIIGDSPAVKKMNDLIDRVAQNDASIVITGESGTGKELVARAIHERSRPAGPFMAVNCAAVPESLLESELFGHARGAYTDAGASRSGLFVESNGGSLFLDEIGDMPLGTQSKILRALQERRVRPVGEVREVAFDGRIITATNRDLEEDVRAGRFRQDLYYRINVVHVEVPPLRARGNDVLLLAQYFLEKVAARSGKPVRRYSTAVAEKLLSYDWPGNVRELENCLERAVALAHYDELAVHDLPESVVGSAGPAGEPASIDDSELPTMDVIEARYIVRVLQSVSGNKTLAAKILGFDRRTLYRKLAALGAEAAAADSNENASS